MLRVKCSFYNTNASTHATGSNKGFLEFHSKFIIFAADSYAEEQLMND